jgi:hypothetical protein
MFFDTLPFPNITAKDAEERSKQTVDYLIQFKEELEFILNSIASGDYGRLLSQPTQTTQTIISTAREESLTVAEVVNSAAFKASINSIKEQTLEAVPKEVRAKVAELLPAEVAKQMPDITFTVNFENGNLEYTIT